MNARHEHRQLVNLARQAEALGFDTFWYADERLYRETYTGLAACAMATSRIALGPAVTDPYTRHPAITAAAIASLDELSDGRAMLGYGAGIGGFHNLGIELRRPAAALRDGVTIIRRLLAGETVTYRGEMVSIVDGSLAFPARADIPIYLAAEGAFVCRLAGEIGDGVILMHCASSVLLAEKLADVRTGQERGGRTAGPTIVARLDVCISRDGAAAFRHAKIRLGRYLWARYPRIAYLETLGLDMPPELDRRLREAGPFRRTFDLEVFRPFADAIPDAFLPPIAVAGTPEQVGRQIDAVLAAGADELMAYLLIPPAETMEGVTAMLAEAIGPRLRAPRAVGGT